MFEWLPYWVIAGAAVIIAILVGVWAHRIFVRVAGRAVRDASPIVRSLFNKTAGPARLAFILLAIWVVMPMMPAAALGDVFGTLFMVAVIGLIGWAAINAAELGTELYLQGFDGQATDDPMAKTHETQVRVLKRCADVLIVLVTAGFALMTFDAGRQIGFSLFGTAGLAAVVVAVAAYPILKNLMAGVQLAMTQPIRIGDTVDVEGQSGKLEDITASSAVLRLPDKRRLSLPLSIFMEKPFQKVTREDSEVVGTVSLPTAGSAPVERVREKLADIVKNDPRWDGKVVKLEAGHADGGMVELRAAVSARSLRDARNLRCAVREQLIGFLQREHPEALPGTTASAPDRLTADEVGMLSSGDGIDVTFDQLAILNDGTLAYKDHRVLLYLRDVHVFGNRWRQPRYHLSHCKALKKMTENGRIDGYAVAAEVTGTFRVNMISAGTSKSEHCQLTVCQNCLDALSFGGFTFQWDHRTRKEFVNAFKPDHYFSVYPRSVRASRPSAKAERDPMSDHAA